MSTRCYIGKYDGNNIKAIYCHHDGYPNGVGQMLKEHYTSDNKIDELISLGAITSLGEKTKLEPIDDTIELTDGRKCRCVVSDGKITFSMGSKTYKSSVFDFPYNMHTLIKLDENLSVYIYELMAKLDKVSVAYHRDRGEEELSIDTFSNESDYKSAGIDYLYLWKNGYWTIFCKEYTEFKRF